MSFRKWVGVAVGFTVLGAVAGTSNGCSSSSSNNTPPPGDAASDAVSVKHPEASAPDETGTPEASTGMWAGTTGKECKSDSDCLGVGGPPTNKCTSDVLFTDGEIDPTPICLDTAMCDPCGGTTPCDTFVHQCDGPDMSAATPGICLALTNPPQPGQGACQPACQFSNDGAAPTGCAGNNVCNPYAFGTQSGMAFGVGFCQGGCKADSDCSGEPCDVLSGHCVKTVPTRGAGKLGDPCTGSTDMSCYCPWNAAGTCSAFCTAPAAGTADPCGAGFACITFQPSAFTDPTTDASTPGFTKQNAGMSGLCVPTCDLGAADAGAASDAAAADAGPSEAGAVEAGAGGCPMGTTCQGGFPVGTVCLPPPGG